MRLLLLCAVALPLGACHASWEKDGKDGSHRIDTSGPAVSRTYAATGFTGVDLTGVDDVTIKSGDTFAVTATGSAKLLDELEIRVDGTTLKVGRKHHEGWSWDNHGNARITVTMPKLTAIGLTGTGDIDADKAEGDFTASLTGTGNIKIAALTGGDVTLATAGTGDMTMAGTATRLDAQVTGPGDIDAGGLTASGAKVSVTGPGSVKAVVKGDADVSILGPGDVELTGGARCKISKLGPGEARCS
jgi:hypothetical protein